MSSSVSLKRFDFVRHFCQNYIIVNHSQISVCMHDCECVYIMIRGDEVLVTIIICGICASVRLINWKKNDMQYNYGQEPIIFYSTCIIMS